MVTVVEHKIEGKGILRGKGTAMVRVIVEHKTKDPEKLIDVIKELRNEAMKHAGYITGETLVNSEDPTNILVISTWQKAEDWDAWDKSENRCKITEKIKELLAEPPSIRMFHYSLVRQKRIWSTF